MIFTNVSWQTTRINYSCSPSFSWKVQCSLVEQSIRQFHNLHKTVWHLISSQNWVDQIVIRIVAWHVDRCFGNVCSWARPVYKLVANLIENRYFSVSLEPGNSVNHHLWAVLTIYTASVSHGFPWAWAWNALSRSKETTFVRIGNFRREIIEIFIPSLHVYLKL